MATHPTSAALIQQGLIHHRQGQIALAMDRYTEVLRNDPKNPDALYYVAVVACQEQQFKQGIELCKRALESGPPQARLHNLIGKAHDRLNEPVEAVKAFDAAIALDPNFAEAHGNRAGVLAAAGLAQEALAGFDRALALDPEAVADWINRAALLREIGSHQLALESYDKALALSPDDPEVALSRADTLSILDRAQEAEAAYDDVIARDPRRAVAYAHKAMTVNRQGRPDEARVLVDKALAIDPDEPAAQFALALFTLAAGDWTQGWPLFEARGRLPKPAYQSLEEARWDGEPPDNIRLALISEQGLGDTVQFGRYAALLAERGYKVTLVTHPTLAPLMQTLSGVDQVVISSEDIAKDKPDLRWLPLMSVMGALKLTPDAIPAQVPYLRADPARKAHWAERLGGGFKIGIMWRGTTAASAAPLAALAPLANIDGVRLISLQKGAGAADIAQAPFGTRIERPLPDNDLSPEALLDTAAVIANLDLVVAIDSMPAHLAGALGTPVFLALRYIPDWRWLMDRDDTPWYPHMRLFRQDASRDWASVFARIADAVRERLAARGV